MTYDYWSSNVTKQQTVIDNYSSSLILYLLQDIDHHDVSVKMLNQHISRLTEELKRAREHNSDTQREM